MKREIIELREVVQKLVPLLTGKGLEVTQRGSQAYVKTDPVTRKPIQVNIPNISDNASEGFIRAVSGFIDHEVAHVLITDWNFYGGGPTPEELKRPEVQKLVNCHNIIEDTMIEREIVKIFPGSKKNIADLREHFIRNITKAALAKAKSKEEEFNYLLVPTMRALAGHTEFAEFMDDGDYWSHPMIEKLVSAFDAQTLEDLKVAETTEQTLAIAKELYDILYRKAPQPPAPMSAPTECENDGESQDKPEKKAGAGDGDGERDHSDQEEDAEGEAAPGEAGEAEGDQSEEDGDDGDQSGGDAAEADDEDGSDDAGGSDAGDPEEDGSDEEAGSGDDGDAEEDGDDGADAGADGDDGEDAAGDGDADAGDEDGEEDGAGDEGAGGNSGDDDDAAGSADTDGDDGDGEPDAADGDGSSDGSAGGADGADGGDELEPDASGAGVDAKTDGGVDDSEAHAPRDDDEESDGGGGVGSEEAKSMFEFDEDALEGRGIAEEMMVEISREAVESIRASDWSVFSREWDRIEPLEPPEKINSKWVPEMEDEVRAMTGRMQKDIERIMASQSHVVNQPGHKRGRLHGASLYRVCQGDPRVFTQKQEHRSKDTAVTLLVDNSGSMSGPKMRTAMLSAWALSTTLDRVKIAHEMIGFTTGGWGDIPESMYRGVQEEYDKSGISFDRVIPLVMPIYKTFDERIDATVKKRVAYSMNAQKGLNGNIDGESLMIAAERLARRPEKRKVMLVLSDGQPAGGRNSGRHLKGTVQYLEENGIETIGIGIMTRAVESYYKNHVVLSNVADLPGQVMTEIKRLLA